MTMFDYVICRYKLPGDPPLRFDPDHKFQTKDMRRGLDVYTIDEAGDLWCRELNPDGEYDKGEKREFTGRLRFYAVVGSAARRVAYAVAATFDCGRLIDINEIPYDVPALIKKAI